MGKNFETDTFTPEDHTTFRQRLQSQIVELHSVLSKPGFSSGPASIGAELELYILDNDRLPVALNTQLLDMMEHPLLTEELNRFNLEFNLSPVSAQGKPFTNMSDELLPFLNKLQTTAHSIQAQIACIGILPTLSSQHLQRDYMTDMPRYRALTQQLSALKGEPFLVDINGQYSLKMNCDEVTLEGANTSFQVHLKVPADRFANLYNAAQLSTPLVLALAGNSPTFLGQRLWHETRIALFKQCIDNRIHKLTKFRQPARVSFGQGWVRKSAWELFAENVALYRPLLPYVSPTEEAFAELNLHHGTVWSWNRAVFDPSSDSKKLERQNPDGHLRIEFRALPAGPTVIDMMANAALAIGLTQALSHSMDDWLPKLPFEYAEYNFYRAAQDGLNAKILWPLDAQQGLRESHICDIIKTLLATAADGLHELGVDSSEINQLLGIIERRLATKQTGSNWQLKALERHKKGKDKDQALSSMLQEYMDNASHGEPVANWK
jgi:gamma-glutamyl:cysteine ligase YbdK (ATP-grasp superfamily)